MYKQIIKYNNNIYAFITINLNYTIISKSIN